MVSHSLDIPANDIAVDLFTRLEREGLKPLRDLTSLPGGRRVSVSCLYRWTKQAGIFLEAVHVSRTLMSTEQAIKRYLAKTNAERDKAKRCLGTATDEEKHARTSLANRELEAVGL